ncbi:MAG: MBL fold metallo-hydrolase [Clostridia bacterium]|nr:MBL fold metallo-hydrolase [Clostridia bacterium]
MKKRYEIEIVALIVIVMLGVVISLKLSPNKENNFHGNTEWSLTQFGDNVGGQMMCFTIEGNKEGLVIIDGGYTNNEEQYEFLMGKIAEHHNIVDAWIITHFDSDHGGQFVRIAKDENLQIKTVYVADTPENMDLLRENAPYETEWETYEEYLTMDLPQKVKVHPGDQFSFIDLKMEVLCSYEDWIDEKTDNLLNNGSIVFKLYGHKESMLFCGDVQNKVIGEYLLENYKKKLKSDYLQVAHHGNNNLGDEFYQAVSPKVAFYAAPDWLIYNERNVDWFTVGHIREFLEGLGTKSLWHNTSPNVLILK